MRQSDIKYFSTWRLRRSITELNMALKWNTEHPGGLSRWMDEGIHQDLRLLRLELQAQGKRKRKVEDAREPGEAVGRR
jgi:hypothetical protein